MAEKEGSDSPHEHSGVDIFDTLDKGIPVAWLNSMKDL